MESSQKERLNEGLNWTSIATVAYCRKQIRSLLTSTKLGGAEYGAADPIRKTAASRSHILIVTSRLPIK
jgi:hypothetical protein